MITDVIAAKIPFVVVFGAADPFNITGLIGTEGTHRRCLHTSSTPFSTSLDSQHVYTNLILNQLTRVQYRKFGCRSPPPQP